MSVLYVTTQNFNEIIAISTDTRLLEEKMYDWCAERDITPIYYHGDYYFTEIKGKACTGWLRFEDNVVELKS